MRIISGKNRGLALASVGKGDVAAHLRPTSDRVRESLFNTLMHSHGDPVTDARVLDLFAGTGALGLEALSRGAVQATFVDDGNKANALLRDNISRSRTQDVTKVLRRNATRLGENADAPFDLVFLDPPYGKDLGGQALASARSGNWIAPEAIVAWEESTPQEAPSGFSLLDCRKYGDTHISVFQYA